MRDLSDLEPRGSALLDRLGLVDRGLVAELIAAYDEPHRRYHTVAHLRAVLDALDRIAAAGDAVAPAVELAAWFHDAVYDPRSPTNERDSADLARVRLGERGADAVLVDEVDRLVMATAGHAAADHDEAVLVDADLAILGADPAVYAAYADAVRAEYAFVDDESWRVGRAGVLRSLLDLDPIFRTAAYVARIGQAKANLTAELATLDP